MDLPRASEIEVAPTVVPPEGQPGAGGSREHGILAITEDGNRNIVGFPHGPEHNIIKN